MEGDQVMSLLLLGFGLLPTILFVLPLKGIQPRDGSVSSLLFFFLRRILILRFEASSFCERSIFRESKRVLLVLSLRMHTFLGLGVRARHGSEFSLLFFEERIWMRANGKILKGYFFVESTQIF